MKKTLSAALVALLALFMAVGSFPVSAKTVFESQNSSAGPCWQVPSGYNEHDYVKCVTFLELTDENGRKNGTKVTSGYDPDDPTTWGSTWAGDFFAWVEVQGEKRISSIDISDRELIGALDLSGCTELTELRMSDNHITGLDVSDCSALIKVNANWNSITEIDLTGCTALEHLYVSYNELVELDVSFCPSLEYLTCYSNRLTELDVSYCPNLTDLFCHLNGLFELDLSNNPALSELDCSFNALTSLDLSRNTALTKLFATGNSLTEIDVSICPGLLEFDCGSNELTAIDVSANPALVMLNCSDNCIAELDLSNNPQLAYDSLTAQGSGYIGYSFVRRYHGDYGWLYARPIDGAEFEGFYDEAGTLISDGEWSNSDEAFVYYFDEVCTGAVFARFTASSPVPGDIDNSGSVSVSDAITALRVAMQIMDASGLNLSNADMDGNGTVSISDAVVIMRMAMGLA